MKTLKVERKIDSTHLQIDELDDWLGKEVDIIIREKDPSPPADGRGTAAGILENFKNEDRMESENKGWTKAIMEKHGNR